MWELVKGSDHSEPGKSIYRDSYRLRVNEMSIFILNLVYFFYCSLFSSAFPIHLLQPIPTKEPCAPRVCTRSHTSESHPDTADSTLPLEKQQPPYFKTSVCRPCSALRCRLTSGSLSTSLRSLLRAPHRSLLSSHRRWMDGSQGTQTWKNHHVTNFESS